MSISVQNISKKYGSFTAINNVSVNIEAASLTALIGPSGSGKSTLLRSIAGLEVPDSGKIIINGKDVTRVPIKNRDIGFVFQHYAAFRHMTVRDNVAFGLRVRKESKAKINAVVEELLEMVGLTGMEHRMPHQLSGGQRQRMALARALATRPTVLLLDEPFGALDPQVRLQIRSWLRGLHEEQELTTVLVTHDHSEALDIADSIVVMRGGNIEQIGTGIEVYDHPKNEFVMRFLGDVSTINQVFVRPHDVRIGRSPELIMAVKKDESVAIEPAVVQRVTYLGFEVRIELTDEYGNEFIAQITRGDAQALRLNSGDKVYVRATRPLEVHD